MKDTCIYVANHRDAAPLREAPYRLLQVGTSKETAPSVADVGVSFDSGGDSISFKNFAYCELTGLYWIWKNTHHDVTGMMHYRRYLAQPGSDHPLTAAEIEEALAEHDLLAPRPVALECSVAEHYCYCHPASDFLSLSEVMQKQPEPYRTAFSQVMASNTMIPCNIMVAKRKVFDAYCVWLFSVLEECEEHIDLYAGRDDYQRRVFGFMAERLLMVWIVANDVNCGFCDVLMLDSAEVLHDVPSESYELDLLSGLHGIKQGQLFDEGFYFRMYDDVAQAYPPGTGLDHYLEHGICEGRIPSPVYSMEDFANLRPRLRSKCGEMSRCFFEALQKEARERRGPVLSRHVVLGLTRVGLTDYAPVYDWAYYTSRYDDIPGDYFHTDLALQHFIEVGMPQGRQGSKRFLLEAYKRSHPELVRRFGDDNAQYYRHYIRHEARKPRSIDWRYAG